jgi:DNA polymerase (family 10)
MRNSDISKVLRDIAIFLEMDDVQFKPRAYEKAADSIDNLDEEAEDIYKRSGIKGLMDIPAVGEGIGKKIEELLKTGKLNYFEQLKKKVPVDIENLTAIEGVGPKTVKILYQKLGIKDIDDLEKAAKEGKIRKLPGFKEKSENDILRGIEFMRKGQGRHLLGFSLLTIRSIESMLRSMKEVKQVVPAGSVRRMKETIGDVDFLVISSSPEKVMDYFTKMPIVAAVYGKGPTKSTVRLENGLNADIRVVSARSFGAALQYFTGNKDHNVSMRRIAKNKGWKLSEYGIFKGKDQIAGQTEQGVYKKLGMRWIEPELRENTGEIEAAEKSKLPELIGYGDLKGDLQISTNWTDGTSTIEEMAEEAKRMDLEYITVTDHTKSLFMVGLDEKMLLSQVKEIGKMNEKLHGFRILTGAEVNVMKDGGLDVSDDVLSQLDVVGAGVHSNLNQPKGEMTERVVKAMENENVDILFHPTCRIINQRRPIEVDIDRIIESASRTGTVLDIDAFPDRLDLKDELIRKAVDSKVKLDISSDAHNKAHLHFLELGIAQARRGWATAKDIVNTRNVDGMLRMLK